MLMVLATFAAAEQSNGADVRFVVALPALVAVFVLPGERLVAVVEDSDRENIIALLAEALPEAGPVTIDDVTPIEAFYLKPLD